MHVLNRSRLTDFVSVLNHWFRCLSHLKMNTATDNSSLRSSYRSRLLFGSLSFKSRPSSYCTLVTLSVGLREFLVLLYLNITLKYYNILLPNWDVSKCEPDYTASHPRRQELSYKMLTHSKRGTGAGKHNYTLQWFNIYYAICFGFNYKTSSGILKIRI